MSETYKALKRAEEEKEKIAEVPSMTSPPAPVEMEKFLRDLEESRKMEILPAITKPRKSKKISLVVEELHRMKYEIMRLDPHTAIKSVLFCSPGRREGNSTVLVHFAQTLAAEGHRVLLVDGNLRNPYLHRAFRIGKDNGLTDLAYSESALRNIGQFIKETSLENIWVITSGGSHPNPTSILESRYIDFLINQIKGQTEWVLVDAPPVISCSDSIALAGKVDGVVLVVEAEKTRWEVVDDARKRLENGGGRIIGVVLNKRHFHIPGWLYKRL
jgi:non-specific protein-tyrosine kinase